jgi:putative transposase
MALRNNKADLGRLIHHSDGGSQYCCSDYVGILNDNAIHISMTQNGDPKENAKTEKVNSIFKDELL